MCIRDSTRTAVLLNVGNIIDMKWVETCKPSAVLYVWQGGMEGGSGVADVLTGRVNPCGRLSDTIARSIEAVSYTHLDVYKRQEGGIPGEFEVTSNEVPVLVEGMLADVSVVKTASGSARPGEALTYTVTVSDAGPSEAENVVLTLSLIHILMILTTSISLSYFTGLEYTYCIVWIGIADVVPIALTPFVVLLLAKRMKNIRNIVPYI